MTKKIILKSGIELLKYLTNVKCKTKKELKYIIEQIQKQLPSNIILSEFEEESRTNRLDHWSLLTVNFDIIKNKRCGTQFYADEYDITDTELYEAYDDIIDICHNINIIII